VRFAEVVAVYRRDHLSELRETTQAMQESVITRHIEPTLGKLRMCDIDALAVQRWLSGMTLAHRTKKGVLALARIIWSKAEEWGYAQQRFPKGRYTLGVDRPVKRREMPTVDQLRLLLASLDDPFRAMAEVALYTGLRISEIAVYSGRMSDRRC
jgi:integrase